MAVAQAPHRWGAQVVGQDDVRFALWAPQARRVEVLLDNAALDGDARHALVPLADGFHAATLPARAGTRYGFSVDGGDPVPDPASRWQPDGVHGASVVLADDTYAWRNDDWRGRPWRETVIYELHVGTSGGYAGVQAQLPALAAMGITAIELMPLASVPGTRNWGYDGVLPYAPAAAYGTPEELKALIDAAHDHGLMVLLDVVYNHFGPDGNYIGQYAPEFFRTDLPTPWGAAIDFRQQAVQRYVIDNALMWLHDYRFDGLRLDAVHAIVPNHFLDTLRTAITASIEPGRHVHLVLENEANQASQLERGYSAQWNDDFHNALHVLLTGECEGYYAAFADAPTAHLARVLGEGFAYQGQPDPRGHVRGERSEGLPPGKFVVFTQNHDQIGNRAFGDRLVTQLSPQRLRVALALTALTPMIPLFFMGEPWGARQPFLFFTDFAPPLDEAVREGRRREFAQFSAFADAATRARIPDPNALATFEASRVDPDEAARGEGAQWRDWFTTLLRVRHDWLVPGLAQARTLGARVLAPGTIVAGWELPGGQWWIALNLGDTVLGTGLPHGRDLHVQGAHADSLQPDGFIARWVPR